MEKTVEFIEELLYVVDNAQNFSRVERDYLIKLIEEDNAD